MHIMASQFCHLDIVIATHMTKIGHNYDSTLNCIMHTVAGYSTLSK